jgi:ring-1,2-phenylacetyl-CoA epoxidase subunit PaaC
MTFARDLDALKPPATQALGVLLLSMADDEFVIGFSDSEWTGIAPMLEEDVAMSSLAQDELGHAQALYGLLAELVHDGRDSDAFAYDRVPEAYLHARLLDHGRGDWAMTIARRYLYETADAVRLEALAESAYGPLRELVAKLRREERYHLMHVGAWFERLATTEGEPRRRLLDALGELAADAGTVLSPLPGAQGLLDDAFIAQPFAALEAGWRAQIATTFERLGLPPLPPTAAPERARLDHSDAFRWLHGEFTTVRRSEPGATW